METSESADTTEISAKREEMKTIPMIDTETGETEENESNKETAENRQIGTDKVCKFYRKARLSEDKAHKNPTSKETSEKTETTPKENDSKFYRRTSRKRKRTDGNTTRACKRKRTNKKRTGMNIKEQRKLYRIKREEKLKRERNRHEEL